LALAAALWGDPKVTALIGGPFTEDQIMERLRMEMASMSAHHVQYWPIFLLENDQHVGCAGLRLYRVDEGVYELGFHIRTAYWGQGIAQEAALAVVKFGFETLGGAGLQSCGRRPRRPVRHVQTYSSRRAVMGSTRVAFRAGRSLASMAATSRMPATAA
jgi:hypothetical protein